MSSQDLEKENAALKEGIAHLENELKYMEKLVDWGDGNSHCSNEKPITLTLLGASGDLAKKMLFPALFGLFQKKILPECLVILGFGRSEMSDQEFREKIEKSLKEKEAKEGLDKFLQMFHYQQGHYTSVEDLQKAAKRIQELEHQISKKGSNRVFYFSIPPSVFLDAAKAIRKSALSEDGWNRIILEKPFGKDLKEATHLLREFSRLFREDQVFRVDHFLGKEFVRSVLYFRFFNTIWEPLWNRNYISNVQILLKEPFGCEGRGGYFDENGIIRDVMQNHLLQVLTLIALDEPASFDGKDVQSAKVKTLKAIAAIKMEDVVVGQYVADPKKEKPGYRDDKTVKDDSLAATFATCVLHVNNSRWDGVPFIMKAGKALDEKRSEVRIQFKPPTTSSSTSYKTNELVFTIGSPEKISLKFGCKKPGLGKPELTSIDLDLDYKENFRASQLFAPYEAVFDAIFKGDQNLFVNPDEVQEAWRIFTPVLHQLEEEKVKPFPYEHGSVGPAESEQLEKKYTSTSKSNL